jgi:predicted acetyltransferase
MLDLTFRRADVHDTPLLATMNQRLIRDEGHRNPMNLGELTARMAAWLGGDYEAAIFSCAGAAVGYALYRREPDHVYLRQFFVATELRRQGIGRQAVRWLWNDPWKDMHRVRLDVLTGNSAGREFWRSVGFTDYCITMESERTTR